MIGERDDEGGKGRILEGEREAGRWLRWKRSGEKREEKRRGE